MSRRTDTLPQPTCHGCSRNYRHRSETPMKDRGVTMYPGGHYCIAGKCAHRFSAKDPVTRVPKWCPKRKSPCELRIYGFINEQARMMHTFLSDDLKGDKHPSEHHYGLRFETAVDLTPHEFWRRVRKGEELSLPTETRLFEIVELDDGLTSACFYLTRTGYRIEPLFRSADARQRSVAETGDS